MTSLSKSLSSPALAAFAKSVSRFLSWWTGELATAVPPRLLDWWRGTNQVLALSFEGDTAVLSRPGTQGAEKLAELDPAVPPMHQLAKVGANGQQVRLLLTIPAGNVLKRHIALPLAVEENLRQTLSFELDRYTPFRPEHVYFDFRVTERDTANRKLKVELAVVQRQKVDALVTRAAEMGLPVAGAVLADELTVASPLNFLPAAAGTIRPRGRLWLRLAPAGLAIVLLFALLAIPIWQKRATAIALLEPLAKAKDAARDTDARRDRLDKLTGDYSFLVNMKWNTASSVLVLDELTKRLPDDTFVTQLDFDGKTVQIQGESASASSLVEQLEASPMFKDVGFKAQLTKIQGTANDRFQIQAVLEPDAHPTPTAAPMPTAAPAAPATRAAPPASAAPATPANTPKPEGKEPAPASPPAKPGATPPAVPAQPVASAPPPAGPRPTGAPPGPPPANDLKAGETRKP